ncbi:MAG: bestrophin family ion channel [Myxococcota bacterium]
MLVKPELPINLIVFTTLRRYVYLFVGSALVAWLTITVFGWTWLALSATPITMVGIALSVFLGIRTYAAYGRYWEGRTLWGKVATVSRHFAHQSVAYLGADVARGLIHDQSLYVHALRCHSRSQQILDDPHVQRIAPDQRRLTLKRESNIPAALVARHHGFLADATRNGDLSDEQLRSFDTSLRDMLDVQGGCERIVNTPLPASAVFFARWITIIFGVVLPFCLAATMGFGVLIIAPLVAFAFLIIDVTGETMENPFSSDPYGLPLTSISLTIERNIRDRVGENETPPNPPPGGPMGNVQY